LALAAVFLAGSFLTLSARGQSPDSPPQGPLHKATPQEVEETVHDSFKQDKQTLIGSDDSDSSPGQAAHKDRPWLGLSTEEASEALVAQLGLNSGAGLVATFVDPASPAAKAGLQKNDVLVEFDGQSLVIPAQLRKLVRVHKEGDTVKLVFYRTGKKQTASATLARAPRSHWSDDFGLNPDKFRELQKQFQDLPFKDAVRGQAKALRKHMDELQLEIKQSKVQEEVRQSMEVARKAIEEALRGTTNVDSALDPVRKILDGLAHLNVQVNNNASVTVRSSDKSAKSLVQTDDSGTIVLFTDPKLHLTAHDKEGRLIFDGRIDTSEERGKVPHDLWEKVQPLLDKMNANEKEKSEAEEE
jgi:hypothetical protein